MHFNHFSKDLVGIHVWRQTQTQSTINNFYEEDMNIFNPRRNERGITEGFLRMEFPLMQWSVAILYKVFGKSIITTRLFMLLIGFFTLIGFYILLQQLFHNKYLSLIGVWAFNFSPTFFYYTINPLPDNMALSFSIWGLALFFAWFNNRNLLILFLSSVMMGLGALCKLPFIIYYIVPITFFITVFLKEGINRKLINQILVVFSFSTLPVLWYLWVIPTWDGNIIIKGMLDNTDTKMKIFDYYQHILISTLPELLLNYGSVLFFLAGFFFLIKQKLYKRPKFILILSLCVLVLIYYFFEANAIAKIHDYYLYPFYPLLFILVAFGAFNLFRTNNQLKYLTIFLLLLLPFTSFLRLQNSWNYDKPGFNKDLLVYKNELRTAVPDNALIVAGNDVSHFIFLYYINKKGWGFNDDYITPEILQGYSKKGAKYLYTDSEKIDFNTEFTKSLDSLILQKGSVKIFKLK